MENIIRLKICLTKNNYLLNVMFRGTSRMLSYLSKWDDLIWITWMAPPTLDFARMHRQISNSTDSEICVKGLLATNSNVSTIL